MRILAPLLILAAAAASASAQSEKEVLADFKDDGKDVFKSAKQALAEATKDLDTALDVFELGFDELEGSLDPVQDLSVALDSYQNMASQARVNVEYGLGELGGEALTHIVAGGADEDVWPTGLMCGDGGALDDLLAEVDKHFEKATAATNKKLSKLSAKLRKKTGMRLTARVWTAAPLVVSPIFDGFGLANEHGLTIDTLVSFNRGGADDDGRIWLAGSGSDQNGPVSWTAAGATSVSDSVLPSENTVRWFDSSVGLAAMPEGNYLVFALQGEGSTATRSVGLP